MFGSLDSLSAKVPKGPRGKSNILQSSSISTEFQVASKTSKMSEVQEVEPPRTRQLAQTLNAEEMMKMDFYSKFTPTSVTLSHFLDHSSGGGTVEDSFLFLRREIPVRLSNMMMELELLPEELLSQPACQEILAQYGQSFKDVLSFENIPNNPESHEMFNQMLTNIRQRHQDTIP